MKNLHLLSADIVARVQHSPDSPVNLAQLVEGLIREHDEKHGERHEFVPEIRISYGSETSTVSAMA